MVRHKSASFPAPVTTHTTNLGGGRNNDQRGPPLQKRDIPMGRQQIFGRPPGHNHKNNNKTQCGMRCIILHCYWGRAMENERCTCIIQIMKQSRRSVHNKWLIVSTSCTLSQEAKHSEMFFICFSVIECGSCGTHAAAAASFLNPLVLMPRSRAHCPPGGRDYVMWLIIFIKIGKWKLYGFSIRNVPLAPLFHSRSHETGSIKRPLSPAV